MEQFISALKNRTLRREILIIAIPGMLETLSTTFTSIIDSKMVSSLGTEAISAISVTNQPRLFIFCIFTAINTVISATIANLSGKKDKEGTLNFFIQSLLLVLISSIVIGIIGVALAKPILTICSGQEDTLEMSIQYFRIVIGFMCFNHIYTAINAALRGLGQTKRTFTTTLISSIFKILFNYLLIDGHLGFPALGIRGAAIATVVSTAIACFINIVHIFRKDSFKQTNLRSKINLLKQINFKDEPYEMWKSTVVENLLTRVGFLITSIITAHIGSFEMSIYAVGMHLMDLNFAIASGFQTTAVAKIGHARGAKAEEKINTYAYNIMLYGLISAIILSILVLTFSKQYYQLFSSDLAFINSGIYVCIIIAVISPIQISKLIYTGFLQGLGRMKEIKKAAIISVTIAQPICNILFTIIFPFGLYGIWISSLISQLLWLITNRNYYNKIQKTFSI